MSAFDDDDQQLRSIADVADEEDPAAERTVRVTVQTDKTVDNRNEMETKSQELCASVYITPKTVSRTFDVE